MITRLKFLKASTALALQPLLAQSSGDPPLVPRPKRFRALGGSSRRRTDVVIRTVMGDPGALAESPEAYRLVVDQGGVTLTSRSEDGFAMGRRTWAQLAAAGPVPHCEIVDWPDATLRCAHLCYHLVRESLAYNCPNFEALLEQIDQLAALKYNSVLIELESMFPYRKHRAVSCKIAFTPQQMRTIGERLAAWRMQIIPMVQCLGHAYNVLIHDEYAEYREVPGTYQQYCPTHPKIGDLYMQFVDEYLDIFPGIRQWHIGGDESRQLGQCARCTAKVEKQGKSKLYVDHVAEIARRVHERGLTPLLWSDMLESHPEATADVPGYVKIVYWNYDLPKWPRPYAAEAFRKRGFPVVGSPGVRFGSAGTELSVYYPGALRGIETLVPRMHAEGHKEFIVTNWMKGSPHENTHYGFAYAADLCWNASGSRADFQKRYAGLAFLLPDGLIGEVYDMLSLPLPYAEPVQDHMPDRLNRFDLSGLRFPAKWKAYTKPEREPEVIGQLEAGLAAGKKAGALLDRLSPQATGGKRQLDLLRLSAQCIQAKARLALALHAGRKLESGVKDRPAIDSWRSGQPQILAAWREAKRKHRDMLMTTGFAPSIEFLSELMFEPAEAEFLESMIHRLSAS